MYNWVSDKTKYHLFLLQIINNIVD